MNNKTEKYLKNEEKALEILRLGYEVSATTDTDVFVYFYPHIGQITLCIYEDGWKPNTRSDYSWDIVLNDDDYIKEFHLTADEAIEKLEAYLDVGGFTTLIVRKDAYGTKIETVSGGEK